MSMSDSDQSIGIALARKREAEKKIQEVIQQFEQQTNLRVDGIDYDRPFTFADRSVSAPIFVTIKAMLP
jgi:hypothetical protein